MQDDRQPADSHEPRAGDFATTHWNRLGRWSRERDGKGRQFQAIKDYIGGAAESSYSAVAAELGITESAARMAASRLRTRYRELLRDEIAHTVSTPEEVDDEVRHR